MNASNITRPYENLETYTCSLTIDKKQQRIFLPANTAQTYMHGSQALRDMYNQSAVTISIQPGQGSH